MSQPTAANAKITLETLQSLVRQQEPRAVFLPRWMVNRLIQLDRGVITFGGPRVPALEIELSRFLELIRLEELQPDVATPDDGRVILLPYPDPDELARTDADMLLRNYWRLLFHARARAAVQAHLAADRSHAAVQTRVRELGPHLFNEARFVLLRERYLWASADDAQAYAQFASLFLELVYFRPDAVKAFFPLIDDPQAVVRLLAADVDGERLLESTHLSGAAGPVLLPQQPDEQAPLPPRKRRPWKSDARRRDRLLQAASDADAVHNDVRAAILRMRVCRTESGNAAGVYSDALRDVDQLVGRLQQALGLDDATARRWRAWLAELLENAAGGWWNAEGRLLYDLQKICVYHEREIYSVGVIEWLLELGRRPLRRAQPGHRQVLMLKSLRSALRRSSRVRLSPAGRAELQRLIRAAIEALEDRLRAMLRPQVEEALDAAHLKPASATESIARDKLVAEIADSVVERGYLSFGGLRDAVSRNQMKLDDVTRTGDLARGDQLLKLDWELETRLDALYHRGEFYLRLFHWFSSLLFATGVGRWITKILLLPASGAYILLEALDHTAGKAINHIWAPREAAAAVAQATARAFAFTPGATAEAAREHQVVLNQWPVLIGLAIVLCALINAPAFRRTVGRGFKHLGKFLHRLFVDFPRWVAARPLIRRIFASRAMRLLGRYVLKPALIALVAWWLVPGRVSLRWQILVAGGVFFGVNVLLNSRVGRLLEQAVIYTLRTTLARFTWDILVLLARAILNGFERMLEWIDRLLYAVDELLRFRAGQGRFALVSKAVLGVFWFYIAYVTRFVVNLLIEPQVNPIKHFPVVTVSHKLLLPAIKPLADALIAVGIPATRSYPAAAGIIWSIPGIFGFLAWEFKENWKLYRANQRRNLGALSMGSHGETLAQLLRPGLHSGTLPKLYHRLRKAQMRGSPNLAKVAESIEHVAHAVEAFVQRELLALLNRHPLYAPAPVSLGAVHVTVTRIEVELCRTVQPNPASPPARDHVIGTAGEHANGTAAAADFPRQPQPSLHLVFEQQWGWIVVSIPQPGWSLSLDPEQASLLSAALLGFYKMAGVDVVAEQVQSVLGHRRGCSPACVQFGLKRTQLLAWMPPDNTAGAGVADDAQPIRYDLGAEGAMMPIAPTGTPAGDWPVLSPPDLLLSHVAVRRENWIGLWESALPGDRGFPAVRVLPLRESDAATGADCTTDPAPVSSEV